VRTAAAARQEAAGGIGVQLPKTVPDFDGAGGCWVSLEQLGRVRLRSPSEPLTWFPHVAGGGAVGPLEVPPEWQAEFSDLVF
jgi:hypothetical protein